MPYHEVCFIEVSLLPPWPLIQWDVRTGHSREEDMAGQGETWDNNSSRHRTENAVNAIPNVI